MSSAEAPNTVTRSASRSTGSNQYFGGGSTHASMATASGRNEKERESEATFGHVQGEQRVEDLDALRLTLRGREGALVAEPLQGLQAVLFWMRVSVDSSTCAAAGVAAGVRATERREPPRCAPASHARLRGSAESPESRPVRMEGR